jgi:uncharacterized membrane protein HdeD (DUF308 family)
MPIPDQWPKWEQVDQDTTGAAAAALYQAKLGATQAEYQSALDNDKASYAEKLAELAAMYQETLNRSGALADLNIERVKASLAHDHDMTLAVHNAYLEVGKNLLDRDSNRADFVQKAAGLISTAYAGLLALKFGTDTANGAVALPLTAFVPTLFLALAILLSTAFLSFLTDPGSLNPPNYTGNSFVDQGVSRNSFILWARTGGLRRAWMLQGAVLSLAFGIVLVPAPFTRDQDSGWLLAVFLIGIATVLLTMIVSAFLGRRDPNVWGTAATSADGLKAPIVLGH